MRRVEVSSVLHSYTGGRSEVEAEGATIDEVFNDLMLDNPALQTHHLVQLR